MPNNQVIAAFFLAATVIIYCAFATLTQRPDYVRQVYQATSPR